MVTVSIALSALFVGLGVYVLCSLSRQGWRRWVGPGLLSMIYVGAMALVVLSLGEPRPMWSFSPFGDTARVLGVQLDEPDGIYLWVLPSGEQVPVSVSLPWSTEMAESILKSMGELQAGGKEGELDLGAGTFGWDAREALIRPVPPVALPLKQ